MRKWIRAHRGEILTGLVGVVVGVVLFGLQTGHGENTGDTAWYAVDTPTGGQALAYHDRGPLGRADGVLIAYGDGGCIGIEWDRDQGLRTPDC